MKIHLLSGFLGSGKTTAIHQAAKNLMQVGQKVGVITNDQGIILVDQELFRQQNVPSKSVINGCFCCRYHDLEANIQALLETHQSEVIFAESVGSCTDIVATVLNPLLKYRPDAQLSLSTFVDVRLLKMVLNGETNPFDETVLYIFNKQLEEAGIVVISKIDWISAEELEIIQGLMQAKYPGKTLLYQNTFDPDSLKIWLDVLETEITTSPQPSLNIDYDIYAQGEAQLAWLDQAMVVSGNNAQMAVQALIYTIYEKIQRQNLPIGHLKFLIDGEHKISFTAIHQDQALLQLPASSSIELLINARIETSPALLQEMVQEAINSISEAYSCEYVVQDSSCFQPGYPVPVYRLSVI